MYFVLLCVSWVWVIPYPSIFLYFFIFAHVWGRVVSSLNYVCGFRKLFKVKMGAWVLVNIIIGCLRKIIIQISLVLSSLVGRSIIQ